MLSKVDAFLFAIILLCFAPPATALDARAGRLELDPSRTLIEFELPGSLHTTHGNFKLKRGVIDADPATGLASGLIVINAASGSSGVGARDQQMRTSVLEADKYPEITFLPDHVSGQLGADGQFQAKLQGLLTLRGDRHEVVLDVRGQLKGDELFASSHLAIPYVDWGMRDPSLLFLRVDEHVNIDITTAGVVVGRDTAHTSR
jgi:polyisoprenoid-binding protein YceI